MIDPLIGKSLGPYLLLDRIGAGGMGAVYRAVHQALDQPRAVKILPPGLGADPAFVTRFVREARLAARLRHPNVVQVFDVRSQDGTHFLAMELLEGRSLRDVQREAGALPIERAIGLLRQLAVALDAAHALGIVHRDVKPANAIVGDGDHLTLVDFGIARALEASALTGSGLIGTPEYMAPELIRGELPGPSVDGYAAGIVAFELLTGRVPFRGATVPATMYSHVHEPPSTPRTIRPGLPPGIDDVILRQLAKMPDERFSTVSAFVDALAASTHAPPTEIASENPTTRASANSATRADESGSSSPNGEAPGRGIRGRLLVAGAALLAILAIVVMLAPLSFMRSWAGPEQPLSQTPTVASAPTLERPTPGVFTVRTQPPPSEPTAPFTPTSLPAPDPAVVLAPPPPSATPSGAPTQAQSVVVRATGGAGLRTQPGNGGQIMTVVPENTPLLVIGADRTVDGLVWRNVRAPNGDEGWIVANWVTTRQGEVVVVQGTGGSGARMRAQPGNGGQIMTVVPENTPLLVIGPDRTVDGLVWRNVRAPNGSEGWIAANFVTTGQ